MRVLVTGGRGFTGSALVQELLGHGHDVTVLTSSPDRVSTGEVKLARADLRDRPAITELVAAGRFDGVCHLAALTRIRDSIADPLRYYDVNLTGTLNLLAALDAAALDNTRVVFASTGAVYGPRDGVLAEDEPAMPVNPYGASKLAAEQALTFQAATGALAAVSLRCFNIAGGFTISGGAGDVTDHDLTRIIPKTLAVAAGTADRLQINGDGGAAQTVMADSTRIRAELGWEPKHSSLEQILGDAWAATKR